MHSPQLELVPVAGRSEPLRSLRCLRCNQQLSIGDSDEGPVAWDIVALEIADAICRRRKPEYLFERVEAYGATTEQFEAFWRGFRDEIRGVSNITLERLFGKLSDLSSEGGDAHPEDGEVAYAAGVLGAQIYRDLKRVQDLLQDDEEV